MFMAPSGLEKLTQQFDFFNHATKWSKSAATKYLNIGYIMNTNQMISLKNKKKETEFLMQVVNPKSSRHIEVFSDPWAKRKRSMGIDGMKLAGGIAKSYYIKKGGEKVLWLTKKDFNKHFKVLFMDNDKFKTKYTGHKFRWSLLGVYIFNFFLNYYNIIIKDLYKIITAYHENEKND